MVSAPMEEIRSETGRRKVTEALWRAAIGWSRHISAFGFLLTLALVQPTSARAEYLLDSGDTLEMTVFGRTDLNRKAKVDVEGNVTFPLIGEVKASGLSLTALRSKIREQIQASDAVRSSDIILELVETRPFYIHGDVSRSGAYPYDRGLTVRHAIALAGGLDTARGRASSTPREALELKGRYNQSRNELIKLQIRIAALQAELSGSPEVNLPATSQNVAGDVKDIIETELKSLRTRITERQKEQEYLKSSLKLANEEVAALEKSQQTDAEARKQQVAEMERVAELSSKGLAASGRVTEEQRATVLLKSREMDTAARLSLARRQREEILWNIAKADERRFIVLEEINTAVARIAELKSELNTLSEQLSLMGVSQVQISEEGSDLDIRIYRAGAAKDGIAADQDLELRPGDVVEIRQRLNAGNKGL